MEVKGFPNYLIYPDGKVFSKARRGTPARILKQCKNGRGYFMIKMTNSEGKRVVPRYSLQLLKLYRHSSQPIHAPSSPLAGALGSAHMR